MLWTQYKWLKKLSFCSAHSDHLSNSSWKVSPLLLNPSNNMQSWNGSHRRNQWIYTPFLYITKQEGDPCSNWVRFPFCRGGKGFKRSRSRPGPESSYVDGEGDGPRLCSSSVLCYHPTLVMGGGIGVFPALIHPWCPMRPMKCHWGSLALPSVPLPQPQVEHCSLQLWSVLSPHRHLISSFADGSTSRLGESRGQGVSGTQGLRGGPEAGRQNLSLE